VARLEAEDKTIELDHRLVQIGRRPRILAGHQELISRCYAARRAKMWDEFEFEGVRIVIIGFDSKVSPNHVRITPKDGGWWVEDDGSSGGAYLNGDCLPNRGCALSEGDALVVGETLFVFR
jgi:hypothetical protein